MAADLYKGNLVGAVSWSFEFENQPWFYGFRDLATNGVDKPVLNVFRMFGKMSGKRVQVKSNRMYDLQTLLDSSVRHHPEIGALASLDNKTASVMIWNYHDEDKQEEREFINVNISSIPAKNVKLTQYRIDDRHSNSYEAWKRMGSPQNPTPKQIADLERAGQLHIIGKTQIIKTGSGKATIHISLPRQGVSLLKMDW
jgi:xylan 1,4-beta-xylosidase